MPIAKSIMACSLALLTSMACATDYYVVVPVKNRVAQITSMPCSVQEKQCDAIGEVLYDGANAIGKYAGVDSLGKPFAVQGVSTGLKNWDAAQSSCSQTFGAGWSLPAIEQLRQLYAQRSALGEVALSWDYYWSSTWGESGMRAIRFVDGRETTGLNTDPAVSGRVWCVRSI